MGEQVKPDSEKAEPGVDFRRQVLRQIFGILIAGWMALLHYIYISDASSSKYKFYMMMKNLQKYRD